VWPGVCSDLQAQLADDDRLAVVDAHRDRRRRAGAVHDGHRAEPLGDAGRGREMIGVGVRVDDEADAQPFARCQAEVAVDLADFGIDEGAGARVGTADEVRLAASGGDLLEDHSRPPSDRGAGARAMSARPHCCRRRARPARALRSARS
jgi:hypothetical protein